MVGGEKRNNLYDKALEFAKSIVLLYREAEKNGVERELTKQFLRSGTSIGANVAEAQGSISESDYIAKIHIAYKELIETGYWLELLFNLNNISEKDYLKINEMYIELSKIIYTIIKNIRSKRS
jgi:four helix bundle protein